LFEIEEDRNEIEVILEQNENFLNFLVNFLKNENFSFEQNFKEYYKSSIIRIFGDKSPKIFIEISKKVEKTITLVLESIKIKNEQLKESKKKLDQWWKEIYDNNYKTIYKNNLKIFINKEEKNLIESNIFFNFEEIRNLKQSLEFEFKNNFFHHEILKIFLLTLNNNDKKNLEFFYIQFFLKFLNLNIDNYSNLFSNTDNINNNTKKKKNNNLKNYFFVFDKNLFLFFHFYNIFFQKLEKISTLIKFDTSNINKNSHFFGKNFEKFNYDYYFNFLIKYLNNKIEYQKFESETFEIFSFFII
jgi:hypothetical protein